MQLYHFWKISFANNLRQNNQMQFDESLPSVHIENLVTQQSLVYIIIIEMLNNIFLKEVHQSLIENITMIFSPHLSRVHLTYKLSVYGCAETYEVGFGFVTRRTSTPKWYSNLFILKTYPYSSGIKPIILPDLIKTGLSGVDLSLVLSHSTNRLPLIQA